MMKDTTKRSRLRLPESSTAARPQTAQQTTIGNTGHKDVVPSPTDAAVDMLVAPKRAPKRRQALGRNRASPARLFKLNALLTQEQKDLIEEWGWGGMLKVMAKEMPVPLSMWVLGCFDPIRSELAIPGRGSIPVNADSFTRVFGLPNQGRSVCYEMITAAIAFFNIEYGIESGSAPEFTDWCKMIKDMDGATNMKFLRAYLAGVISCFISPTTKSAISPRCYQCLVDLDEFSRTNFAQFAIDQIITKVKKMGVKKKSACCCLHHLVILYLDSLEVDEDVISEDDCPIRAAAWNDKLIQAVMRKDSKGNREFGKLKLKQGVGVTIRDSLFVGMTRTEEFVSSKLPRSFPNQIVVMIGELCTDISNRIGSFVEQWGNLENDEARTWHGQNRLRKRQMTVGGDEGGCDDEDDEDDDDYKGESEDEDDSDDNDSDEDEDEDNNGNENNDGDRNTKPGSGLGGEDEAAEKNESDLQKTPRRSARLTPKKNNDGHAGNLRKRSIDNEGDYTADLSIQGLNLSSRTAQKEQSAGIHAEQENWTKGVSTTLGLSPFSELREYMAVEEKSGIDMTHSEQPEYFDVQAKRYAHNTFMEKINSACQSSPPSAEPLDQFARDDAIHKLTEEFLGLGNLEIRDGRSQKVTVKQNGCAPWSARRC